MIEGVTRGSQPEYNDLYQHYQEENTFLGEENQNHFIVERSHI